MKARRWITVAFAAVVACFVAATAFVHWEMRAVDRAAREITTNTAPSIERLADARAELRHLQAVLDGPHDARALAEARQGLDARVDAYLALPILPEERAAWQRVLSARARIDEAITRLVTTGDDGALAPAIGELHDALTEGIRGNAVHTLDFANEITSFRERATVLAIVLDVFCTLVAVAGAWLVRRALRAHTALLDQHRRLHEERASELEAFAGRVAHDILGPLGAVSFALELSTKAKSEEERAKVVARGLSAIDRIKKLVSGLLDFARAGGKPSPDARADLQTTLVDLVEALDRDARAANAELTLKTPETAAPLSVACSPGVLTSLLSNLARNALKYLGDVPERRVEIRARDRGPSVRVEVADTGPGVPPDLEAHLFEPYVRAPNARQPGFGLGLATVKRLAEGHGGKVGVESTPGHGATFWFELPKAC